MRKFGYSPAFTVLEMLMAITIFSLVVGGIGSFVTGAYRMMRGTIAMNDFTLQQREMRERLLFRVLPDSDGAMWSGLLSGSSPSSNVYVTAMVVENSMKVLMRIGGVKISDGSIVSPSSPNLQLVRSDGNPWFGNDYAWLRPMKAEVVPDSWVRAMGSRAFAITLGGMAEGVGVTNRMVIPLFGAIQAPNSTAIFALEDTL